METNSKEKIKSTISQKQNWKQSSTKYKNSGKLEIEKMLTKSKPKYFSKILGEEKPIKRHKLQGQKKNLHRVFLVSFLICNSFVLPPHGRLNLFS